MRQVAVQSARTQATVSATVSPPAASFRATPRLVGRASRHRVSPRAFLHLLQRHWAEPAMLRIRCAQDRRAAEGRIWGPCQEGKLAIEGCRASATGRRIAGCVSPRAPSARRAHGSSATSAERSSLVSRLDESALPAANETPSAASIRSGSRRSSGSLQAKFGATRD